MVGAEMGAVHRAGRGRVSVGAGPVIHVFRASVTARVWRAQIVALTRRHSTGRAVQEAYFTRSCAPRAPAARARAMARARRGGPPRGGGRHTCPHGRGRRGPRVAAHGRRRVGGPCGHGARCPPSRTAVNTTDIIHDGFYRQYAPIRTSSVRASPPVTSRRPRRPPRAGGRAASPRAAPDPPPRRPRRR